MMGLGGVLNNTPPEDDPDAMAAIHCWNFCDGYHLEALPLYAAIYGLDDPEKMVTLLMQIRENGR